MIYKYRKKFKYIKSLITILFKINIYLKILYILLTIL